MIINAILSHGRKVRIETTSDVEVYTPASNSQIQYWVWGRRWIKSTQKFSGTILGNALRSYEIETVV